MNKAHLAGIGAVACFLFAVAAWRSYHQPLPATVGPGPVDAIIVFGSPVDITGTLLPMQVWRVDEAVAEYHRGVAPHLIFTGGPAANRFVESRFMADRAIALGIPPGAVVTEEHSTNTLENLRFADRVMQAHGWRTAELISSADHLPRIGVLARPVSFRWRLHAAPTPGRGRISIAFERSKEASATLVLRSFGSAAEPVIHVIAVCEQWIVFAPKWVVWKLTHRAGPGAGPGAVSGPAARKS